MIVTCVILSVVFWIVFAPIILIAGKVLGVGGTDYSNDVPAASSWRDFLACKIMSDAWNSSRYANVPPSAAEEEREEMRRWIETSDSEYRSLLVMTEEDIREREERRRQRKQRWENMSKSASRYLYMRELGMSSDRDIAPGDTPKIIPSEEYAL